MSTHEITIVKATDLNAAWWLCMRAAIKYGHEYTIERGSCVGQKRKELDYVTVQIKNPGAKPLVPLTPAGVPAPTSIEYIEKEYLDYLMCRPRTEKEDYTYGEDIVVQYDKAVRIYREEGHQTNQVCFAVGNPRSIFLESPQCLRVIDTRIRYGKLHFYVYFRSWDLYGGFPANLAGIQLMKEGMAEAIGVQDGELIASSKGLHLYDIHWDLAKLATNYIGAE